MTAMVTRFQLWAPPQRACALGRRFPGCRSKPLLFRGRDSAFAPTGQSECSGSCCVPAHRAPSGPVPRWFRPRHAFPSLLPVLSASKSASCCSTSGAALPMAVARPWRSFPETASSKSCGDNLGSASPLAAVASPIEMPLASKSAGVNSESQKKLRGV
jgi:hypothetical protein